MDRATAEAQTRYILPSTPTIVGNYADLQRMGAAAVTGTIPTGPDQGDVTSSNLSEAFTMPPDNVTRDQLGDTATVSAASAPAPAGDTQAGAGTDTGTATPPADQPNLDSMTKDQLAAHASTQGVTVDPANQTKAEMIDAIKAGG